MSLPYENATSGGAFLGQILLPNGNTLLDHVRSAQLLPALEGPMS